MIDRTLLTEALAHEGEIASVFLTEPEGKYIDVLVQAARLLLDFPTDQQVEAAVRTLSEMGPFNNRWDTARAVLVAVRDTMIGDNS